MDSYSSDRPVRRKSLSERLGLKGFGCCGTTWGLGVSNLIVRDDEEEDLAHLGGVPPEEPEIEVTEAGQSPPENGSTLPASLGTTNLAAALAAERQFRAAQELGGIVATSPSPVTRPNGDGGVVDDHVAAGTPTNLGTPPRVSLMRLLEETDGYDNGEREQVADCESVCCVCMGRKKGAAFIPCGHTFCRVCSRELWLNRGFCPLCNRSILEILDIF